MSDSGSRAREITSLQLADTLPFFATALSEVPSPTNRLGVRSGGEVGTTPALTRVVRQR
jgi:carbon-monoxide dehydrogenase large subunit